MVTSTARRPAEAAVPASGDEGGIGRYVNLTRELALTQFKLKYTGSVLGYLWSLIKPLLMFAINYAVFVKLLRAGGTTVNFPLQLLVAIVLWNFFTETVSTAMGSIAGNGHMIRKAYFPRWILIVAASLTAFLTFLINITLIVVIAAPARQVDLSLRTLAVLPLVLELYALIIGLSLLLSAVFVFYRDLGHLWEVSTQVIFYASAIVFPIALLSGRLQHIVLLNPIAQIIEDIRQALVASDASRVPWTAQLLGAAYLVPLGIVAATVVAGTLVFNRLAPRFAESL